jgi:hypothetical protein
VTGNRRRHTVVNGGRDQAEVALARLKLMDADELNVATIRASLADGGPDVGVYRKATKRDDWRDVPLTAQMVEVFSELFARCLELLEPFGRSSTSDRGFVFNDDPDGATHGFDPTHFLTVGSLPDGRAT